MIELYPLNSKAKKLFYEKVRTYFGLSQDFIFDGIIFMNNKNKYFLIDHAYADIADVDYKVRVTGVYIAEINDFGEIRLSIEGSQMIGPYATEHVLEITEEEMDFFIRGEDLDLKERELPQQYFIIKYSDGMDHFMGCGKIKNGTIFNFIPKNRRIRD